MKSLRLLLPSAFTRLFGLLAYLGLSISFLGIPSLAEQPPSDFKRTPDFYDGVERGVLGQSKNVTILTLVFYGGLLGYCFFRFLKEPRDARARWLDGASLAILAYFTLYACLVHTEWKFSNQLPPKNGALFTEFMMPADRLGWFLVAPAEALEFFVPGPGGYR